MGLTKLQRMFKHVLESEIDRGRSFKAAQEIAARTVNRYRGRLARGKVVCTRRGHGVYCREVRGPKLVGQGGSRRQWYPGKKGGREVFACLKHRRRFRTKAALKSHYRSHRAAR